MIVFFDFLVQRELEGNSFDLEMLSEEEEIYERFIQLFRLDIFDILEDEVERYGGLFVERFELESDMDSIDDFVFSFFILVFVSVMVV